MRSLALAAGLMAAVIFPPWGIAQEDPPTQPPVPLFPRTMQIGCAEQAWRFLVFLVSFMEGEFHIKGRDEI